MVAIDVVLLKPVVLQAALLLAGPEPLFKRSLRCTSDRAGSPVTPAFPVAAPAAAAPKNANPSFAEAGRTATRGSGLVRGTVAVLLAEPPEIVADPAPCCADRSGNGTARDRPVRSLCLPTPLVALCTELAPP